MDRGVSDSWGRMSRIDSGGRSTNALLVIISLTYRPAPNSRQSRRNAVFVIPAIGASTTGISSGRGPMCRGAGGRGGMWGGGGPMGGGGGGGGGAGGSAEAVPGGTGTGTGTGAVCTLRLLWGILRTTKSPSARGVKLNRTPQRDSSEVGPQRIEEHHLGIR